MGVINLTPDSFYTQSRFFDPEAAVQRAHEIAEQGADILDIGAESARPGSDPVSEEEELLRVKQFFSALGKDFPLPISIDTRKPSVARYALLRGAKWINDVSGFCHPEMLELAVISKARLCVVHMQGEPKSMQENPTYPNGIIHHLKQWFFQKIDCLIKAGIAHENIVLDPGIGFGKSVNDNLSIITQLNELKVFGCPLLIGGSRKSFMKRILGKEYQELLPATLIMHTLAATNGAEYLRVHDIDEHKDLANLLESIEKNF